jgi:hypothetical protein
LWECFRKALRGEVFNGNLFHSFVIVPHGLLALRDFFIMASVTNKASLCPI